MKNLSRLIILFVICSVISCKNSQNSRIRLLPGVKIVVPEDETAPVKFAVSVLQRDLKSVFGEESELVHSIPANGPAIIIVNNTLLAEGSEAQRVSGNEAHAVYTRGKHIVLEGADMRGTIYAIYTFSEKILGIPPLWFWASRKPEQRNEIRIGTGTEFIYNSPYVKYRTWFPNDQDNFSPWRKINEVNNEIWLETMLRLKMNCVEGFSGGQDWSKPYQISETQKLVKKYGLIQTSHHPSPLNSSLAQWDDYWTHIRKVDPPELLLENHEKFDDFWRYNIENVLKNDLEMIWVINFRGNGDRPFWATFEDSPESMEERAEFMMKMLKRQVDLIKEITKVEKPYMRMTFYDEISDMIASGLVKPPEEENLIWNFVAARRDHYPNLDLVQFQAGEDTKMGYYLNLQFTSTGSHLAQAEGPWKMERNYRYIDGKSPEPLLFSVINAGNIREHLLGLSANAALLWDFENYNTDEFLSQFCMTYFGLEYAEEIADLYRDFFFSYWNQKKNDFEGFERQYIFQDMRYARALGQISNRFFTSDDLNPLRDYSHETTPNRTFRIVPGDNDAGNQIDAILKGTSISIEKLKKITIKADSLSSLLLDQHQPFFSDNLNAQAHFMLNLNIAFNYYCKAYKGKEDQQQMLKDLENAYQASLKMEEGLAISEHGDFECWLDGDRNNGKFNIKRFQNTIKETLTEAEARHMKQP